MMTSSPSISINVNGEPHSICAGLSIQNLVSLLGLNPKKVAVERNLEIIPRSTLAKVIVEDGDILEIVHFVGGG